MIISREVIDIQSQGPGSNPTDDSLPKYLFKNQVNILLSEQYDGDKRK